MVRIESHKLGVAVMFCYKEILDVFFRGKVEVRFLLDTVSNIPHVQCRRCGSLIKIFIYSFAKGVGMLLDS